MFLWGTPAVHAWLYEPSRSPCEGVRGASQLAGFFWWWRYMVTMVGRISRRQRMCFKITRLCKYKRTAGRCTGCLCLCPQTFQGWQLGRSPWKKMGALGSHPPPLQTDTCALVAGPRGPRGPFPLWPLQTSKMGDY